MGRINNNEVHDLAEDLSEVAHLIIHNMRVGIETMEAEDAELASQLLLCSGGARLARHVKVAEHSNLYRACDEI